MDLKELSLEKLPVAEEKQEEAEEKPAKKELLKFLKKSKKCSKPLFLAQGLPQIPLKTL